MYVKSHIMKYLFLKKQISKRDLARVHSPSNSNFSKSYCNHLVSHSKAKHFKNNLKKSRLRCILETKQRKD